MKLSIPITTIWLFLTLLCWFHRSTTAHPDVCMKQTYEPGDDKKLESSFRSEFSIFDYVRKKALWLLGYDKQDEKAEQRLKELCACALYKKNDHESEFPQEKMVVGKSYELILQEISKPVRNYMYFYLSDYWFSPRYNLPYVECESGSDQCIVLFGMKSKSAEEDVRDVYVGVKGDLELNLCRRIKFLGVIKDVKMDPQAKGKQTS